MVEVSTIIPQILFTGRLISIPVSKLMIPAMSLIESLLIGSAAICVMNLPNRPARAIASRVPDISRTTLCHGDSQFLLYIHLDASVAICASIWTVH
jgi:hypothetical protein